jgi:glycerophosphoryl diester phosphodiesterase
MQVFKATSKVSHMFELDLVVTKDGKLIVHHDPSLRRTCGVNQEINQLNFDELPIMADEYQSFGGGLVKTQRNKLLLLDDLF